MAELSSVNIFTCYYSLVKKKQTNICGPVQPTVGCKPQVVFSYTYTILAVCVFTRSNQHAIKNASVNNEITKFGWRSGRGKRRGGLFT